MGRLSDEERRQREKEERSRQRIQDQAYREAQRAVYARIYGEYNIPDQEDVIWDRSEDRRTRRASDYDYDRGAGMIREEMKRHRNTDAYDTIPNTPEGFRKDMEQAEKAPRKGTKTAKAAQPARERKPRQEGTPPKPPREKPPKASREPKEPRAKRTPQQKRRLAVLIAGVIAALLLLGLAAHAILVHRPDLPAEETITVHPTLQEAGRKEDVFTFLLVGRDDAGGGNTDTIMVGCYDVPNGTLDVMSLYRDTLVDVPWDVKKLNSVYNNLGMDGLRETIQDLMGYAPDYYFLMEMDMVAQVVDAMGGVDYDIPFAMHYDDPTQDLHIHYEPGMQHLSGEDAVKILRWRQNNSGGENLSVGDVGRVELQHAFLNALMGQALSLGTLMNIGEIIGIVDDNLTSNLSYGEMMWFGEKFLLMDKEGLQFHTMPGDVTGTLWSSTYQTNLSYVFVNDSVLRDIVNAHMNPYTTDITADMQNVFHATTVDNLSGSSYAPVG